MSSKKASIERVIFFSKEDLAWSHMLEKAERLLNHVPDFSALDLDSLLEFYHVKQYFDHGIFLHRWTGEQKSNYLTIVDTAVKEIRKYFLKLEASSLQKEIGDLDSGNKKVFWHLFGYFEIYKRMDRSILSEILTAFPSQIRHILKIKQLVGYYNNEIRAFLLTYTETAELLLSHYEEKHPGRESEYIFPTSLSVADIHLIITTYLDTEEPNLNYVDLARNSKYLKLTPKILLKAKQVFESVQEKHFTEENSTTTSVEGSLDMNQTDPVIRDTVGTNTKVTYGGAFFDTLTTDIQLFSVFSDIFLYTNEEGLIELVSKDHEVDELERIFMRSKNEYYTGIAFSQKNMLSIIQLEIFNAYLVKKGRSLEQLIDSFVHQFFRVKFQVHNLEFSIPDGNISPSDKIRLLAPELEYLLKQYKSYVLDGAIDHELLQIDSMPVFFSDIPSLVPKKFIISDHETITKLQYYFFGSHNLLSKRSSGTSSKNLFQTLMTEKINRSGLEDYKQRFVDLLVKEGFLIINDIDVIEVADPVLIFIAGRLRRNGSISYWRQPLSLRLKIDLLIKEGILKSSGQLFTNHETSYINYYLNRKEFTNGHDLRNKYLHGSNDRTLEVQKADYRYFLRIVVLILLKLKDDLEIKSVLTER